MLVWLTYVRAFCIHGLTAEHINHGRSVVGSILANKHQNRFVVSSDLPITLWVISDCRQAFYVETVQSVAKNVLVNYVPLYFDIYVDILRKII